MSKDKDYYEGQILFLKGRLMMAEAELREYIQQEYELRKKKNLEVESDRKDFDRADKALEHLRRSSTNE